MGTDSKAVGWDERAYRVRGATCVVCVVAASEKRKWLNSAHGSA